MEGLQPKFHNHTPTCGYLLISETNDRRFPSLMYNVTKSTFKLIHIDPKYIHQVK